MGGLVAWPTCSARDWKDSPGMATTGVNPDGSERSRLDQLPRVAALAAPWATPRAEDAESSGMRHSRGVADTLSAQVGQDLVGWVSPTAQDGSRGDKPPRPQDTGVPLSQQVVMVGWSTPKATDAKGDTYEATENRRTELRKQAHGLTSTSSPAGTENRGALNPAHSRWLQGFPVAWCQAAIRASRKLKPARKRG